MKYIELQSKGYSGLINHSILQDGDVILSFEDGEYKLYNKSYLKGRKVLKSVNIPKLDLNCFEGLELLYKSQGIKMNTGRLGKYLIWCLIAFIFFCIGIWYGVQLPNELQSMIKTYFNFE